MDPRIKRLAKLLIGYSLELKKGQLIKIQGEYASYPLIKAAYDEAIKVGAFPYVELLLPETRETLMKNGSDAQLKFVSPLTNLEVNKLDAMLSIWGTDNKCTMAGVDPKRMSLAQSARKKYMMKFFKRVGDGSLSWVGTQFPTAADAQDAEMSLSEYEDFVFGAGHLNSSDPEKYWKKIKKEQTRIARILNKFKELHITCPGTDLKMNVKGRKWISCHGTENFPDGEIFTGPIENSVEGVVSFSYPGFYNGKSVEGVKLEFKAGKVVKSTAERNEKFLKTMLDIDPGAKRIGEFAIGTNYQIKQFTRNTLFDEKIGGTFHMALGASIPESGGVNKSAIHWDMVNEMKDGGEIKADGKIIYRKGKFLI